jgi:uncharacterized protein involved in exopolysaccharide biosynthesis
MLVYDQPIGRTKPDREAPRTAAGFNLGGLARLLWQRRIAIAAAAVICACAAIAVGKTLTPK